LRGINIQIAIFDNRIEITSPGALLLGITIEKAISGVSKIRNRVIAKTFKELGIMEQSETEAKRYKRGKIIRLGERSDYVY